MKIAARTKYLDLKNNFSPQHLYAVIGYVFVLCLVSVIVFAVMRDWLTSLTFLLCAIAGYVVFTQSPQTIEVEVSEDGISIDNYSLPPTDIISWALVDLGDTIEVIIRTKNYTSPFLYFYIPDDNQETFAFIQKMREVVYYDASMPRQSYIHNILRYLNLK